MATRRWVQVWCVAGCLLAAGVVQAAKTNYVSATGVNKLAPFTSWALATSNLYVAVTNAVAGDTVLVTNGTYWITNQIPIVSAITVKSIEGASKTTVRRVASGAALPQHRIFYIRGAATVDGFTVRGGYLPPAPNAYAVTSQGAGIYVSNGIVQNCRISGNEVGYNWASRGGGVYMLGSSKLQFSTVVSNTITPLDSGAGVYATGNAVLYSNTIAYNNGCGATLVNQPKAGFCTIERNSAGGVYGYTVTLTNSIVRFNTASRGAGLYLANGNTILDCSIVSNRATDAVGGAAAYVGGAYSPLLFRRCDLSGNTNANCAGIYFANINPDSGTRTFELCRIADNVGARSIYMSGVSLPVRFRNCTISSAGRVGFEVGSIGTNAGVAMYPSFVNTIVYNHTTNIFSVYPSVLSTLLAGSFTNSCSPQLPSANGNMTGNPAFVAPAAKNYRLKSTSPCVGAGTTSVLSLYTKDIENVSWAGVVNIGCYKTVLFPKGSAVMIR